MSSWRKMVPCPKGCGKQVRYKGPNHSPGMCRTCYLEAVRSGALSQDTMEHMAKMRRARALAHPPRVKRDPAVPPAGDPNLIPMHHLWFERERVFEFVYAEVRDVRVELSKDAAMGNRWDGWRSRPWLRFDQVDELFCVLGLWVGDLGEPTYSGSEKRYPVLVAA